MSNLLTKPSSLLVEERVILDLEGKSKKRVFEEVGLAFENSGGPSRSIVLRNLLDRERLGSTLIAEGAAIPHAKIKDLHKPLAAFVRMHESFPFDSPSAKAKYLFVLIAPDRADTGYLQTLSLVSRLLADQEMLTEIDACNTGGEFLAALHGWEHRSLHVQLDGTG